MKVAKLIKRLQECDPQQDIVLGNDEELNHLFDDVYIDRLVDSGKEIEDCGYVIYPNQKTEKDW